MEEFIWNVMGLLIILLLIAMVAIVGGAAWHLWTGEWCTCLPT